MIDEATTAAPPRFEPPGGGWWELETVHTRGAVPNAFQEIFPEAMRAGMQEVTAAYGLPMSHIEVRFVADHCYTRAVPIAAPEPPPGRATKAPPPVVLKALSRVHPAFRRRSKAAASALATRRWEGDRQRWLTEIRPARIAANRAVQEVDVDRLDGTALATHLRACLANAAAGSVAHFILLGAYNVPVGRFVVACDGWGIDRSMALDLLAGASPASSCASAVGGIGEACAAAGIEPTSLDAIRSASPQAAAALDAVLVDHAWRVLADYTPRGCTLAELPELLVSAVRRGVMPVIDGVDPAPVRTLVPEASRADFDDLLDQARAAAFIRDDNVGPCFMWPMGLLRRALLAVGRRMVDAGRAQDPTDALWISSQDLEAFLDHGGGPDATAVAGRVAAVAAAEESGAPAHLGWSEGDPPDPAVFPAAVATLTSAFLLVLDLEMPQQSRDAAAGDRGLTGVGVGRGRYRGRAVVARTVEEAADRLEPGDVLVTTLTTPAYNVTLMTCGAVVTEQGGLLSHTALVARELGMPAVCGIAGACASIPDLAQVEVDAEAGEVRILTH